MEGSQFFFEKPSNVAGDYEKLMTKIKNGKMQASTKLNALEKYIYNWNKKSEDDIEPLQKNLVYMRVTCDVDMANKISMSLDGYYSQIVSLAEKMDDSQGHDESQLRDEFDKLNNEVETKRTEALQKIELQIETILKDARRYSDTKQMVREGGGVRVVDVAPSSSSSSFKFRPIEELAPGEISQDISPGEFGDWLLGFEDYMMTGCQDSDIPDKFRVSYFLSKCDKWWKCRLRSELNRDTPWVQVVKKMEEVLLATNPLFLRRVNTFALRQKSGQLFSEFCHEHIKAFSLASCEKMNSEDLRLHLILGAMSPGKLRDRLFVEKNLDMKKMYEMTAMF